MTTGKGGRIFNTFSELMQPERIAGRNSNTRTSYIPVLRCRGVDSGSVTLSADEARYLAHVLSEKAFTPAEFERLKSTFAKLDVPTFSPADFFGSPFSGFDGPFGFFSPRHRQL